jgi:hypothetical protein
VNQREGKKEGEGEEETMRGRGRRYSRMCGKSSLSLS